MLPYFVYNGPLARFNWHNVVITLSYDVRCAACCHPKSSYIRTPFEAAMLIAVIFAFGGGIFFFTVFANFNGQLEKLLITTFTMLSLNGLYELVNLCHKMSMY